MFNESNIDRVSDNNSDEIFEQNVSQESCGINTPNAEGQLAEEEADTKYLDTELEEHYHALMSDAKDELVEVFGIRDLTNTEILRLGAITRSCVDEYHAVLKELKGIEKEIHEAEILADHEKVESLIRRERNKYGALFGYDEVVTRWFITSFGFDPYNDLPEPIYGKVDQDYIAKLRRRYK